MKWRGPHRLTGFHPTIYYLEPRGLVKYLTEKVTGKQLRTTIKELNVKMTTETKTGRLKNTYQIAGFRWVSDKMKV